MIVVPCAFDVHRSRIRHAWLDSQIVGAVLERTDGWLRGRPEGEPPGFFRAWDIEIEALDRFLEDAHEGYSPKHLVDLAFPFISDATREGLLRLLHDWYVANTSIESRVGSARRRAVDLKRIGSNCMSTWGTQASNEVLAAQLGHLVDIASQLSDELSAWPAGFELP